MNKTKQLLIVTAALLLLVLAAVPAGAQGTSVSATVDRNQLTTDDTLLLTVSVD